MTKPWADGPHALIPSPQPSKDVKNTSRHIFLSTRFLLILSKTNSTQISPQTLSVATTMCWVHNLIYRNLNALLLQYTNLTKTTDISDFLIFCQCVHEGISTHHHHEEIYFFPAIEEYTGVKGIMDANVKQHHAFEEGLKSFGEYVYSVKAEEYDSKVLGGILDSFVEPLVTHLRDEIPTLLGLEKYGGEKLFKVNADVEKKILEGAMDPVCSLFSLFLFSLVKV